MVFSRGYKEKVIETVNPFVSPFYCFLLLLVESVTACCMFFSGVIAFWSFHMPMTVMTEVRMCPH